MNTPVPPQNKRLSKISSHSLGEIARELIHKAILEGEISPDSTHTIDRVATALGISRTPAREAIKSLENDGILRILPNKGFVVQQFSNKELQERYAIRAMLEAYAGAIACTEDHLQLSKILKRNVAEMEANDALFGKSDELQLTNNMIELNREFHNAIIDSSGCSHIKKILSSLQGPVTHRLQHYRSSEQRKSIIAHHRRIAEAFENNQPDLVRAALHAHISDAGHFTSDLTSKPKAE